MPNFSIGTQIENELKDFFNRKIALAAPRDESDLRYLKRTKTGYHFNQSETITLIDLVYNSKFPDGEQDKLGQTKIYLNVSKFRCDVSSKQIDLDTKDGRFIPEAYADPWVSFFMQRDFAEWAQEHGLAEKINDSVDSFPRYGTVVGKEVGKDVVLVPLQNIRIEQSAESIATASYFIEEHPEMYLWEMQLMPDWDTKALAGLKFNEALPVYERYGRVPLDWLKRQNDLQPVDMDASKSVDAVVIVAKRKTPDAKGDQYVVLYASEITKRPYREAHWARQHGRWLGIGVIEDLFANQTAALIIANLRRRSLHWSAKRIAQTGQANDLVKNLMADTKDGQVIEVGPGGEIKMLDLSNRNPAESQEFLAMFEHNSDQKAFTYEVSTGEALPSGTPFRLGVVLSNATNAFFSLKREKLGLFWKKIVDDFLVEQFFTDMDNEDRVLSLFADEPGFEALKVAALDYVRSEASRLSLLTGKAVDANTLIAATTPFQAIRTILLKKDKGQYASFKAKFKFTFTGEEVDLQAKLETWKTIYTLLAQRGDPRADQVLDHISALTGDNLAMFSPPVVPKPPASAQPAQPGTPSPFVAPVAPSANAG